MVGYLSRSKFIYSKKALVYPPRDMCVQYEENTPMDFRDLLRNSKRNTDRRRTDIRGDVNTPPQLRRAGDNNCRHSDRLKLHSHNIIEFHRALHWDHFLPYTPHPTPLSAIISSLDINHHLYIDHIQIYMSLSSKESLRVVATLVNGCIGLDGRVQAVA